MNNELLLLIDKHTDTLIEETKTKPQEALEFKMNRQMQTFRLIRRLVYLKLING